MSDGSNSAWLMLTARGALHAFSMRQPDGPMQALQALLAGPSAPTRQEWLARNPQAADLLHTGIARGWIQPLVRPLLGPDTRLDDFVQHVIASLSGERRAVLASDTGFCLGRAGVTQDEADSVSAAAADLSEFASRQARRGWAGAGSYASFSTDPLLLMPDTSFVPLWVDGTGYVLVIYGEPLLNNPALVELIWGIREAATRFQVPDSR